jgi:DNA invertase Pin-like site-specific DNA recombinase
VTQNDSSPATTPSTGAGVGYTRVSTVAQTLEQQNAALAAAGVTKTFSDTMSDGTGLVRQAVVRRTSETTRTGRIS